MTDILTADPSIPPAVAARVEAGAAWLDTEKPDWAKQINMARLNMVDPERCILGQLHGNYFAALAQNALSGGALGSVSESRARGLGFQASSGRRSDYVVLGKAWRLAIKARRVRP